MTGRHDRVAVVIPVRNRPDSVVRAIGSVVDQWIDGTELVVVDDGSTDDTADAVVAMGDRRIRLERQSPRGVSAARNLGVRASANGFLTFLDSDDAACPGWLEAMTSAAIRGVDVYSCAVTLAHVDGTTRVRAPEANGPTFGSLHALFRAGTLGVRRDVFDEAGGYRVGLRHGENSDLGMRVGEVGGGRPLTVDWTDDPLVRITTRDRPYDAELQYESATTMLNEASHLLELDPSLLATHLAIAGVAASRIGRRREALRLLGRAVRTDPRHPKHLARLIRAAGTRSSTP